MTRRGERGQSLIVAVAFVTAFTLLVTAALSLAGTSLLDSQQIALTLRHLEATEAGAELGLQEVRAGSAAAVGASKTTNLAAPVHGESVAVTVVQLDVMSMSVDGPASLALGAAGDYRVLRADGTPMPFGATWSVAPPRGATIEQTGRFSATENRCYVVRATFGNVTGEKRVAVGTGGC